VRCIRQVLAATEDTDVDLGIENHGHISNDPAFLDGIFNDVPNARLGLTLDTGNFYWYGAPLDELYQTLKHFAPRARHTHLKSIAYPPETRDVRREKGWRYAELCCPIDEGDLDYRRIVQILRDAGYDSKPARTLCVENEALPRFPLEERADILRRDIAALRNAQ
jgi:sugar phosphate isomerase/epimerase